MIGIQIMEGVKMKKNFSVFWTVILFSGWLWALSGCTPAVTPPPQSARPSPVVNASPTATVTPQKTLTPTFIPEPSPTPTETATPTPNLPVELIIDSGDRDIGTLFVRTDGSIARQFKLKCNLSVVPGKDFLYCLHPTEDGSGMELDRVDYIGNVLDHRSLFPDNQDVFNFCFNFSISPDGRWVTYMHGDNGFDPRFSENLDLFLLDLEQKGAKALLVTKNHCSTNEPVTWTSNGEAFVYADKDQNGIVQLFKIQVKTLKTTQLTYLGDILRGQSIYQAKISPDDERIAFTTLRDTRGYQKIGVVKMGDPKITWMQMPASDYETDKNPIWWDREGKRIMAYIIGGKAENIESRIVWYDVKTGSPIQFFPEKGQPRFSFSLIFPLKDIDVVGFCGNEPDSYERQYWLYDAQSKKLKKIDLPELEDPYQFIQLNKQ
jgi:hypothetical protein